MLETTYAKHPALKEAYDYLVNGYALLTKDLDSPDCFEKDQKISLKEKLAKFIDLVGTFYQVELSTLKKEARMLGVEISQLENDEQDYYTNRDLDENQEVFDIYFQLLEGIKSIDQIGESLGENFEESVFLDFLKVSEEEQIELINDRQIPHLHFLSVLDQLSSKVQDEAIKMIFTKDLTEIESHDYTNLAMSKSINFAIELAKLTNNQKIWYDLLSLNNSKIEEIAIARELKKDLRISGNGLFTYWGLFSEENQLLLITAISSMDQFESIVRFISYHASVTSGELIWNYLLKSSLALEIKAYINENAELKEFLKNKYPKIKI